MCGITGFYSFGHTLSAEQYYSAHLSISHRGPNDEGFFFISRDEKSGFATGKDTDKRIEGLPEIREQGELTFVMGHRRLSIIDLSTAGHQPFAIGDKLLSYNGEIYNYVELKKELQDLGVAFRTNTDTEVFLAAYCYWGDEAFNKFNGMWAAAIYDKDSKKLTLVRDRFGVKPLYYILDERGLFFASEIKYFKKLGVLGHFDENAIYQYVRYSETDFDEGTFFENVKQIQPGEFAVLTLSDLKSQQYWNEDSLGTIRNPTESVEALIIDAINLRLRSDVPVGSLLSGGIDSSLIVGIINQLKGLNNFEAYSAVFEDREFSEKKYVDDNAKFLNFEPNYVYPQPEDLVKNIEQLVYVQEMPFRSLSVLSQFLIYKEVFEMGNVKVLLNGQGADEIFTGYSEHYAFYFESLFRRFMWKRFVIEFFAYCKNKNINLLNGVIGVGKIMLSNVFFRKDKYGFFSKPFVRIKENVVRKDFSRLKKRLYRNLAFSALREYLRYEDKNSMYFSLESRLPFLDYRLVKSAFSIDDLELIVNGETKVPLRKLCEGKVAPSIIARKDKTGFISPQERWQKNDLKIELDKVFKEIEKNGLFSFMNTLSLVKFYEDYKSDKHNDWALIWRIYCLYKWKQEWINE